MATQVIEEFAMSELHSTSNKDDTKSSSSKAASNTKPQANALDTVSNANQESAEPQSPTSREDNYVHGFRLIILTISLMLAVFIIALDTTIIGISPFDPSSFHSHTILYPPSNTFPSYRRPKDHLLIPLHLRHWLVLVRLPPPSHGPATHIRENLHLFRYQNCLPHWSRDVRSRFGDLCNKFWEYDVYHREGG
jgi:hypothetical protein